MNAEHEEWRPVAGYIGRYEVSSLGRIWSHWSKRVMRPRIGGPGYPAVELKKSGSVSPRYVHHLVAEAFLGPRPQGAEIRHLNGDKTDNRLINLRYGTRSEQRADDVRLGVHFNAAKTHCKRGHPLSGDNLRIRNRADGRTFRLCLACKRIRQAATREPSSKWGRWEP